MHVNEYILELKAEQFIKRCRSGFANHIHWMNWRAKHNKEIESFPPHLRNRIVMAWDNSGPREKMASKASPPSGGPK